MFTKGRILVLALAVALAFVAGLFAHEPAPVANCEDMGRIPKVCVIEQVPAKKTVYGVVCKDYCVKHSFRLFHGMCDLCGFCGDEGSCDGCELHSKQVLVKKIVPGPCKPKCVLKDAPPVTVYEKIAPAKQ